MFAGVAGGIHPVAICRGKWQLPEQAVATAHGATVRVAKEDPLHRLPYFLWLKIDCFAGTIH